MTALNDQQRAALSLMMVEGLKKKDPEIIRGCLAMGGSADHLVAKSSGGLARPLLHWSALDFSEATAQLILDATSDIDLRDSRGNTALMVAIENRQAEAVEFLMKNGASPLAQNASGVVPLDVARNIDQEYYSRIRDRIIKALTADYGRDVVAAANGNTPPAAAENIAGVAAPSSPGEAPARKKPARGFTL